MHSTLTDDDHRRYPRVPVRQHVWCEGEDVTLYVRTVNASDNGMFIRTVSPGRAGRRFRVSFEDNGSTVVADVQVVWSREPGQGAEPGMGVEIVAFAKGAEAYHEWIARVVAAGSSPGHLAAVGEVRRISNLLKSEREEG